MQLVNLAQHPEKIATLASWHYKEWGSLYPDESLEDFESDLEKCLKQDAVPATFVAVEDDELIGSISVLARDMDIDEPWGPWLANFYVTSERRNSGVGKQLVEKLLDYCSSNGITHLYLFTPSSRQYYERLGWTALRTTEYHGQTVDIMRRAL